MPFLVCTSSFYKLTMADLVAILANNPYNQVEQHGIEEFHEDLPELPTEPISFDDENWEEELDGEGEPDTTWDEDENEKALSTSNQSSATLSSRASKRSFDELESGGEGYDEEEGQWDPPSSPGENKSFLHISCMLNSFNSA